MAGMIVQRIAFVTGGAGGLGAAIVARLAEDGCFVIVADKNDEAARAIAKSVGGEGAAIDLGESASVDSAVGNALARHGRLDILVNAAGIHLQKLVVDMEPQEWDRIQAINARGPFLACRAAAKPMMRQRSGRIVNLTTRLGFGNPYSSAYMASKSALLGFTQCLAVELAAYGVTVNAVAPGHVGPGTGMEKQFREKAQKLGLSWEAFEAQVHKTIPVGRWCSPEDVAAAVSYVASPAASFVTGETINVTGGFTGYGMAPAVEPRFTGEGS